MGDAYEQVRSHLVAAHHLATELPHAGPIRVAISELVEELEFLEACQQAEDAR